MIERAGDHRHQIMPWSQAPQAMAKCRHGTWTEQFIAVSAPGKFQGTHLEGRETRSEMAVTRSQNRQGSTGASWHQSTARVAAL
jgi:hypothetical protein